MLRFRAKACLKGVGRSSCVGLEIYKVNMTVLLSVCNRRCCLLEYASVNRQKRRRDSSFNELSLFFFIMIGYKIALTCLVFDDRTECYLFSASIAFIFCFTSSISSFNFWIRRFISSIRLFPFFELMFKKPRLFS